MVGLRIWGILIFLLLAGTCSPATDTVATPPIPTADVQFGADRSYIKVGMCVVFSWQVENSKAVYFYAEGEWGEDKIVSPHDSRKECRTESTRYYLRAIGFDDAVEMREIHIPVEPMPGL